jgi:hypothetical protein
MTPFREEIQAARREYQAIRYPGELSRQLLAPKMRWKHILVFGSAGLGGIAAAAVVAALMFRPLLMPSPNSGSHLPLVQDMGLAKGLKFAIPRLPGVPDDLSLRALEPDGQSPSQMHLPLWDDLHLPHFTPSSEHA